MRFSIITAVKNNKEALQRAYSSVRAQSYKNYEFIILDGASDDGTLEFLKSLPNDIKWISEPDNGIYDAINKGIRLATGDVIGLLHSDDFFADEKVLQLYADAFQNNDVSAVYSDLVYVSEKFGVSQRPEEDPSVASLSQDDKRTAQRPVVINDKGIVRRWITQKREFISHDDRTKAILNGWMPPHPTLYVRKSVFDEFGLYRTDMKIAADYEMILRLFYKHRVRSRYLPVTTYCMSMGGASNRSIRNILKKSIEDYRGMKIYNIKFAVKTLFLKNVRKLKQFI